MKSTPAHWPSASVGSDALESLRDGNPPNALLTFARNAIGAGQHAWAIEYLRRGVDYLRYVTTSFPDVADTVQPRLDAVIHVLVHAGAAIGDEAALEHALPTPPSPAHVAGCAWKLLDAKHAEVAQRWFARARAFPMDEPLRTEHLLRFGVPELIAQKRAKMFDSAFAEQLVELATEVRAKLDSSDPNATMRKHEIEQLLRTAKKAVGSKSNVASPSPKQKPSPRSRQRVDRSKRHHNS